MITFCGVTSEIHLTLEKSLLLVCDIIMFLCAIDYFLLLYNVIYMNGKHPCV